MMENESGLIPLGRAILLLPYEVKEKTKGGLILPNDVRDRELMAEQRAVVVAIGAAAWEDESSPRAKVGDKVLVTKYAGYFAIGPADGKKYRIVNDRDIFAGIVKENNDE